MPLTYFTGIFHCFFLALFVSTSICAQSDQQKEIKAHQLSGSNDLRLDGKLDEAVWSRIEVIKDFVMQVPVEGGSPTERSEIRIAYDENNLYIAIQFYDKESEEIKAFQKKRDVSLKTDDQFQWILDTYLDGRNAYYFAINPAGAIGDGLLTIGQGSSLNLNWDGIWRAWTHIHAEGWSAEIRIPFRTLNFDPNNDTWGINFQRTIRRKNEEILWSGHLRSQGLLRPQNAGILSGLNGITQGIGLEAVPYAAARRTFISGENGGETSYEGDAGFDVNYNITPGLKASVTYNTDFAEAEVDSRRINLTRFPLLFPEKRDFFLEGSSIYSFAPTSGIRPYFSRTIGLKNGQVIPITLGARILGRVGQYDVALQHVRTGTNLDIRPEHFSVARIKRNIGKESRIGFVYTRRTTQDGDLLSEPVQDRHTFGADLELNTSKFLGDKNFQFQAFFVFHNPDSPLNSSKFWDRTTRGIRVNFPNRPWSGFASYREFGIDFQPAVGFHSRVGFRRFQPSLRFNPFFEKSKIIRDIRFELRFEHLMDLDWQLLTQEIRLGLFDLTFESSERISVQIMREFERLTGDFDILRDGSIIIPPEDYVTWGVSGEFETASFRAISASIEIESGGFWSGNQSEVAGSITIRPVPGINFTGTYVYTDVDLVQGAFTTDLMRFNASFDLTPFLSFSSFIQWDNLSDQLGINNRFQWIITPGRDLFFVYNHNWEDRFDRFRTLNSTVTMKATYTHRF